MTAPTDTDLETAAAQADALAAKLRSWKGASPTPPSVTPPATGFTGLSLGDPSVWDQTPDFADDFTGQAAGPLNSKGWYAYPKGWTDTSKKGTYDPARATVVDRPDNIRALRQTVTANSDGSFGGCVLCPASNGQPIYWTDVRYSERVQLLQQDNGHYALLGWPANDADWETKSGEPDDVETDTLNNPTIGGFIHVIGDSNDAHKVQLKSVVSFTDKFHVVTIEQLPSKGKWRRYIDGVLSNVILNAGVAPTSADKACPQLVQLANGLKVPGSGPLRRCKQLESNGKKPTKGVILDTDWVFVQTPA